MTDKLIGLVLALTLGMLLLAPMLERASNAIAAPIVKALSHVR